MKISVITPSYNQGHFIQRTLDSILNQSGNFEIEAIVMDGGSTDETIHILESYGDRIQYVSESDKGQADALNKGLAHATGDVIGWLNSDDTYEPGCLQTVASIFSHEPQTQWLYGKVRIIDEQDCEIRKWITCYKNWRMQPYRFSKLLTECWISQMGVFWRREAGEEVGPFRVDLRHAMDYDFWLRLGQRWPGRYVDEYLANFRWYTTSKSGAEFVDQTGEAQAVAKSAAGDYKLPILMHKLLRARTVAIYSTLRLFRRSN